MYEIEAKAVLSDKAGIVKSLEALGCVFSEPVLQEDAIYVRKVGSRAIFLSNDLFLRLRSLGSGETIFTAKYHKDRSAEHDTSAIEHELIVGNRDEMEKILLLQGYTEAIRIRKTRQTAHYESLEICIDEVDGLGTFIEVEKLTDMDADRDDIYGKLRTFLLSLGIPESDLTTERYDMMILRD